MELTKFFEENLLLVILVLMWLSFSWTYYLSRRQKALMEHLVDMPESIKGLMTETVYSKSRNYSLDKLNFGDFSSLFNNLFSTVFLLTLSYRRLWDWSVQTTIHLGLDHENEMLLSVMFMLIMNVLLAIVDLPLNVYKTFVLEEKYNFNKQKPLFFAKDQLLQFVVMQAIVSPVLCAMIWIIRNGGEYFFLYLWLFAIVATLFLMVIYPEFIAPLFDKYTPLPEGELRQKIEELAKSVEFPLYKLFVVEGSKRSSHSNAYLYGFHKHKRIVLFDTLVKEYYKQTLETQKSGEGKHKSAEETNSESDKCDKKNELKSEEKKPDEQSNLESEKSDDENVSKNKSGKTEEEEIGCETEEVLAVLAHEIGHWKYSHALKGFLLAQFNILINCLLYAKFLNYTPMYAAFGFDNSKPIFIGFTIVTMYLLIPLMTVMQYMSVVISRRFEFQADKFATLLGHGEHLKKALLKLQKDNLGYPLFDKLYSSWHHSHPPILERLEAIEKHG